MLTQGGRIAPPGSRRSGRRWIGATICSSPDEQLVLRRLGVFAGGCIWRPPRLSALRPAISAASLLDLLSSLIDKSLLLPVNASASRPRLRLVGNGARVCARIVGARAESWRRSRRRMPPITSRWRSRPLPSWTGRQQDSWLAQLDQEDRNLSAALNFLLSKRDRDAGRAAHRRPGPLLVYARSAERGAELDRAGPAPAPSRRGPAGRPQRPVRCRPVRDSPGPGRTRQGLAGGEHANLAAAVADHGGFVRGCPYAHALLSAEREPGRGPGAGRRNRDLRAPERRPLGAGKRGGHSRHVVSLSRRFLPRAPAPGAKRGALPRGGRPLPERTNPAAGRRYAGRDGR